MAGKLCDGSGDCPTVKEAKAFCAGRASRAAEILVMAAGLTGVGVDDNGITWTAVAGGKGVHPALMDPGANDEEPAALLAGANTGTSSGLVAVVAGSARLAGGTNPFNSTSAEGVAGERGVASKVAAESDGCCAATGAAAT